MIIKKWMYINNQLRKLRKKKVQEYYSIAQHDHKCLKKPYESSMTYMITHEGAPDSKTLKWIPTTWNALIWEEKESIEVSKDALKWLLSRLANH